MKAATITTCPLDGGALDRVVNGRGELVGYFCSRCRKQYDPSRRCKFCDRPVVATLKTCGAPHGGRNDR